MAQGNLEEHTHTHSDTYTHFLSLREKGQYPEEEMVSHCYDWSHDKVQGGRSVTFIVKLIIPQKKIPLPCSRVLSAQQSCWETLSLSLHAEMSWAHQKLLGARLYAYRGNMHNPETRTAATEKEYFNCVVRVSNLTINSQQKENC